MAVRRGDAARGGLGIAARYALGVGGSVALMLVVYAFVVLGSAGSALEEKVDAIGLMSSRALAAPGADGWLESRDGKRVARPGARRGLKVLVGNSTHVLNAYITNNKGSALVQHYKVGGFDGDGAVRALGLTRVERGTYTSGDFRATVRLYRTPLLNAKGRKAGLANVVVSEQAIEDDLASLRTTILLLSLLLIALVIGVSFAMSNMVTGPLRSLVQSVSRINRGNLTFRSTIRSNDEVGQLSRAVEGMCESLREGAEAWERLGEAAEEAELVSELRTAMLPSKLPDVAGFEVLAAHEAGSGSNADMYDAVPLQDGRLALIVASTSGSGALGALLAAMTRAYIRAYLEMDGDAGKALRAANRNLTQSMRKGLHVTCQVAVLDPKGSRATVFIAGHRAPFYACRGGEVSVVHGEGLALGLDRGEVFDRRLEEVVVEMPPGTRIVLTTTGTYEFEGADGQRYGVDRFQDLVRKHAPKNSDAFLHLVLGALRAYQGDVAREVDATLFTAKRMV